MAKGKLPSGNVAGKFHDSIHGKALQGAAQGSAPTCTNCHGSHNILAKSEAESRTNRAKMPDTCGTCHKPERAAYMKGMHGKLRQDGVLAAPGCTDCHTAHAIQQHEVASFQTEVIKECGTCHSDYLSTYRDTFHGQVTALGYARMATCASCHGAHDVRPASDPASTGLEAEPLEDVPEMPCRAPAPTSRASIRTRTGTTRHATRSYYYAAKFMELLLLGVFSFFGIHTAFWLYRELREKFGKRQTRREALMTIATGNSAAAATGVGAGGADLRQRYYRRFTPIERVMHAALMLTFVGCALSGLPLLYSGKPWATTLAHASSAASKTPGSSTGSAPS